MAGLLFNSERAYLARRKSLQHRRVVFSIQISWESLIRGGRSFDSTIYKDEIRSGFVTILYGFFWRLHDFED